MARSVLDRHAQRRDAETGHLDGLGGPSVGVAVATPALAQAQDRRPPVWEQMTEFYKRLEAIRVSRPADFGLPVWYDMAQLSEKVEGSRAGR